MFSALIFHEDDKLLSDSIKEKTLIWLPTSRYFLCLTAEENPSKDLPSEIGNYLVPVSFDTGFVSPVRAYPHFEYVIFDLPPKLYQKTQNGLEPIDYIISNRKLLTLRSKLNYAISELLAPSQFYFQLETPYNPELTQRIYTYKLYYNEVLCYFYNPESKNPQEKSTESNNLLKEIQKVLDLEIGPTITSTRSLTQFRSDPPDWYIRETFRDLCELQEIKMKDKVLLEGPSTGHLYLFYKNEINLVEADQVKMTNKIRELITGAIMAKIFPRRTPEQFIKTRRLIKLKSGQWKFPFSWFPDQPSLFKELLELNFTLRSSAQLFWFLYWIDLFPTSHFIKEELGIFVKENSILINYRTRYFPDFLRIKSLSRISHSPGLGVAEIYYPQRSPSDLEFTFRNNPYIYFYDNQRNDQALVVLVEGGLYLPELEKLPKLDKLPPEDYSLDARISNDQDSEFLN